MSVGYGEIESSQALDGRRSRDAIDRHFPQLLDVLASEDALTRSGRLTLYGNHEIAEPGTFDQRDAAETSTVFTAIFGGTEYRLPPKCTIESTLTGRRTGSSNWEAGTLDTGVSVSCKTRSTDRSRRGFVMDVCFGKLAGLRPVGQGLITRLRFETHRELLRSVPYTAEPNEGR